jgi:hypothetical protein
LLESNVVGHGLARVEEVGHHRGVSHPVGDSSGEVRR